MFRPGENYIYDIMMMIIRFWWGVIKVVGFIVVYWRRERAPSLQQPQAPSLDSGAANAVKSGYERRLAAIQTPEMRQRMGIAFLLFGLMFLILSSRVSALTLLFFGGGLWLLVFDALHHPPALAGDANGNALPERGGANDLLDSSDTVLKTDDVTVVYTISLPRQSPWSAETALHFVNQLVVSFPQLLLSISADHEAIVWQVLDGVYGIEPTVLEQLVRTSYPNAEIDVNLFQPPEVKSPFYRYTCFYRQLNMFVAPIAYVDSFKTFDPLTALSQAMTGLQAGERVTYVLALAGIAQEAYQQGERLVTQSTIHPLQFLARGGVEDAAAKILTGRDRMDKYEYRDQKVLEDKLRETLCYAYLWIQVDALDAIRVGHILALLDSQMAHFTRSPFNALAWVERPLDTYTQWIETESREQETHVLTRYRQRQPIVFGKNGSPPPCLILEPREIAALWHLPYQDFSAPRIAWASRLSDVPEAVTRLDAGIVLGVGKYQGQEAAVRLAQADRVTHLNVVGRTGMGKSTLLHTLIHQDIASGAGVAVIDPHGQLVRDVLRYSIPPSREADVVVLDIANEQHPPPLNPLSSVQGYASSLKLVGIVERLFAGTEGAARMASYLRAALLPLGSETQATMRDVTRMFMDDVYREQRLTAIDDPETLDFWDYQYNGSSPALQRQIADPIINRIRPFYANPTLYPILCHPGALDLQAFMQQGKILLISLALDEERVPEQERNLIGALLMSQLQVAGMKARLHAPFYFYVDEVQRFVTTSLSEMLSEARKHNLALITANQYLGQLTGKTLEAVMGNVGTTVIFRCSPDDARDLAAYTRPQFDAQALTELDRFQAVVKLQVQGSTQPAFSLRTLAPLGDEDNAAQQQAAVERERYLRQESSARYTPLRREEVLAWLKERYPRRRSAAPTDATTGEESSFYE